MLSFITQSDHPMSEDTAEGQLSVDVYRVQQELCIVAPMAGADPSRVVVSVRDDLLTIKGERTLPFAMDDRNVETFLQESFFGPFSRTIVLPVDVKSELAKAEYLRGVLTIRIPIRQVRGQIPITIVEE